MRDVLTLVFTFVIAVATTTYTYFSYRLWRATRASVDLARFTGFMSLMVMLNELAKEARARDPAEGAAADRIGEIIGEFGIAQVLKEMDVARDPEAQVYFARIEEAMRAAGKNPETTPGIRAIFALLKTTGH